ncbi:MAG: peptidoglycan DD-metalloendopeptidase family protein [Thermodesulfobacteriota bacterium]
MPQPSHRGRTPARPQLGKSGPLPPLLLLAALLCLLGLSRVDAGPAKASKAAQQQKAAQLAQKEKLLVDELENADRELALTRQRFRELSDKKAGIEKALTKTRSELILQKSRIADLREEASSRCVAYYKMCRLGLAPVFLSAGSFFDAVATERALARVLSEDRRSLDSLTRALARQEELASRLLSEEHSATSIEKELSTEIQRLGRERDRKKALLATVRSDRRATEEVLRRLSERGRELSRTVRALAKEPAADKGFAILKGSLPPPVTASGRPVREERSGLFFDVAAGEPVRAVCGGKVAFAGWFAAYGNLIIVDHGDGYFSVYAHAEDLFKQKGDRVEKGEVIATAGDTGSALKPGLYFEIRHHVKALPAGSWLASRTP